MEGNNMKIRNVAIPICLLVQTMYCWWCFYKAKGLPYDDNYGILLHAIFISMLAWVIVRMFRAKWFGQFHIRPTIFWTWILIGSPVPFLLAFFFYSDIFGTLMT
jgi:hypothetical protein